MILQYIFIAGLIFYLIVAVVNIFGAIVYDLKSINLAKVFSKHPYARALRKRPLVSIIVVPNNFEDDFKKCLFSIAKSSYRKCEILIMDDGSASYLKPVQEQFTKRYRSKKIKLSKTSNNDWRKTAKKSKGEYIVILNASYELEKSAIAEAVKHFTLKPNDNALRPSVKNNFDYTLSSLLRQYEYLLTNQWQKTKNLFSIYDSKYLNVLVCRHAHINRSAKVKYLSNMQVFTNSSFVKHERNKHLLNQVILLLAVFLGSTYFIYLALATGYTALLALVWVGFSVYLILNIWAEEHIEFTKKIQMCLMAPMVCLLFYFKVPITIFRSAFS